MEATLSDWKEFIESPVYRDMIKEIDERYQVILPKLIAGKDPVWTDDCMRGRLDELEFVASIATDMIAALELDENKDKKEGNTFMNMLFKNFINKGEVE